MNIKIYQIDAFADELFTGNPASVCVLENWLSDDLMQKIAAENNLAETAFLVKKNEYYEIRWFTPMVEVDLCGHATLAAAFVLLNYYEAKTGCIIFYSPRSGLLEVTRVNDYLTLDFPVDIYQRVTLPIELKSAFLNSPIESYRGKTDFLLVFEKQEDIQDMKPDLNQIAKVFARGIIVTAPGRTVDFVYRFFAPQSGIPEDHVTGSAHTTLTPYWSDKLNKTELTTIQLSSRTGKLICKNNGSRILISGKAQLYMVGEINV